MSKFLVKLYKPALMSLLSLLVMNGPVFACAGLANIAKSVQSILDQADSYLKTMIENQKNGEQNSLSDFLPAIKQDYGDDWRPQLELSDPVAFADSLFKIFGTDALALKETLASRSAEFADAASDAFKAFQNIMRSENKSLLIEYFNKIKSEIYFDGRQVLPAEILDGLDKLDDSFATPNKDISDLHDALARLVDLIQ